jgi:hypothetical protein
MGHDPGKAHFDSGRKSGQSGEERKQFFFEKKNQKTFFLELLIVAFCARSAARPQDQKFFASFFPKKKALPLSGLPSPDCPGKKGQGLDCFRAATLPWVFPLLLVRHRFL